MLPNICHQKGYHKLPQKNVVTCGISVISPIRIGGSDKIRPFAHLRFYSRIILFYTLLNRSYFPFMQSSMKIMSIYTPAPPEGGVYCFTSVRPSVQDIFRRIFLSNY